VASGETVWVKQTTWQGTLNATTNPMEKWMHMVERKTLPVRYSTTYSTPGHNEPEVSISGNVQQVKAGSSVEYEAGALHNGAEQPTNTQAEF
jgi:hypothetical protein